MTVLLLDVVGDQDTCQLPLKQNIFTFARFSCPREGYINLKHDAIKDTFAYFINEVCYDVEPHL